VKIDEREMMKRSAPRSLLKSRASLDRQQAETLALQALAYLAEDKQRIQKFLQLTGVDAADLPALAPRPRFLLAVLDHLAGDEELLVNFSRTLAIGPEKIGLARHALGGLD
jgi:hypothetical protein